jgi:hypothetical protein
MTSSTPNPIAADRPAASSRFDQFVSRRLDQAGTQVKWIDLASSLILVLTVVLAVLLIVCVVDAWILPLGKLPRIVLLVGLLTYMVVSIGRAVLPLLGHRINPAYAARMIEQSEPTFKNSLLNYVFLRGQRRSEASAVIEAVQEKAAQDLSRVPLESAIDRSRLIQVGFALLAVTLIGGLYKLLSPKDPFATIARVAVPLSEIQAPSRMRIVSVEPGSVDVFFGDTVSVTADIRGAGSQTPVALMYTTTDGQRSKVAIPLQADSFGNRFSGMLTTSDAGIQHSLHYWIVAGDGRSADYSVTVRPSPTIAVERIELTPPAYTELPPLSLLGRADIDAIEGTRVRLNAVTNLPIASATVELLNAPSPKAEDPENAAPTRGDSPPLPADPAQFAVVERLPMSIADQQATAEFQLLRSGSLPKFTHYRLQFTTPDGQSNRISPAYAVKIQPDIAPELEVLEPNVQQLQVPQNGSQSIRVRALDPDFRITAIRLIALHQGRMVLEQNLPLDQPSGVGNVQAAFRLRPDAVSLQAGDKLIFHLLAKDNRHSPLSDQLDPNITRSANYELTVTEPVRRSPDQNRSGDNNSGDGSDQGTDSSEDQQGKSDPSGQQKNDGSSDPSADEKNDSGEGSEAGESDSSSGDSQSGEQRPSDNAQAGSGAKGGNQAQPSGEQSSSESGMKSDSPESGDPQASDPKTAGDPTSGGERQGESSGAAGERPSGSDNSSGAAPAAAGQQGAGEQAADAAPNDAPQQRGESSAGDTAPNESNAQRDPSDRPAADDSDMQNEGSRSGSDETAENPQGAARAGEQTQQQPTERPLDEQSTDGERFEQLMERMNQPPQPSSAEPGENSAQSSADQSGNSQAAGEKRLDRSDSEPSRSEGGQPQAQNGGNRKPDSTGRPEPGDGEQAQPSGGDPESETGAPKTDGQRSGDGREASGNPERDAPSDSDSPDPSGQKPNEGNQSSSGEQGRSEQAAADGESGPETGNESPGRQQQRPADQRSSPDGNRSEGGQESPNANSNGAQDGNPSQSAPQGSDPRRQERAQTQYPDSSQSLNDAFNPPPETNEELEQLERSREVTDLVLEYLRDQSHRPNSDLLNEMNWTDEELRAFVERWTKLKEEAATGDEAAQRRYSEALRSLGLRSQVEGTRRAVGNRDQLRDLNEDGAVSRPPAKYAEAFRDFSKGRSQSGNDP